MKLYGALVCKPLCLVHHILFELEIEHDAILCHVKKIAPVLGSNACSMSTLAYFYFIVILILCSVRNHPAIDRSTAPQPLRWYHPQEFRCNFEQLQFKNSTIARAFQAWNSGEGVTAQAWHFLSTSNIFCQACQRMFSYQGFKEHAPDNKCNKPRNNDVKVDVLYCSTCSQFLILF